MHEGRPITIAGRELDEITWFEDEDTDRWDHAPVEGSLDATPVPAPPRPLRARRPVVVGLALATLLGGAVAMGLVGGALLTVAGVLWASDPAAVAAPSVSLGSRIEPVERVAPQTDLPEEALGEEAPVEAAAAPTARPAAPIVVPATPTAQPATPAAQPAVAADPVVVPADRGGVASPAVAAPRSTFQGLPVETAIRRLEEKGPAVPSR